MYAFLSSPSHALCPVSLILLDLNTRMILDEEKEYYVSHCAVFSSPFDYILISKCFPRQPYSRTHSAYFLPLNVENTFYIHKTGDKLILLYTSIFISVYSKVEEILYRMVAGIIEFNLVCVY